MARGDICEPVSLRYIHYNRNSSLSAHLTKFTQKANLIIALEIGTRSKSQGQLSAADSRIAICLFPEGKLFPFLPEDPE